VVPLGITLAGAIAFAVLFHAPQKTDFEKDKPAKEKAVAVAEYR
jgi:hypothetical protein